MVTDQEIIKRLGVTEKQLEMAIYSGYIPKPWKRSSFEMFWSARKIEPFLQNWERRLAKSSIKLDSDPFVSGCITFPVHQR